MEKKKILVVKWEDVVRSEEENLWEEEKILDESKTTREWCSYHR